MPAGSSVLGTGAARAGRGHRAHPGDRGLMSPWEMGSASSQGGVLGLLGQGTPLLTGIIRGTSLALLGVAALPTEGVHGWTGAAPHHCHSPAPPGAIANPSLCVCPSRLG